MYDVPDIAWNMVPVCSWHCIEAYTLFLEAQFWLQNTLLRVKIPTLILAVMCVLKISLVGPTPHITCLYSTLVLYPRVDEIDEKVTELGVVYVVRRYVQGRLRTKQLLE